MPGFLKAAVLDLDSFGDAPLKFGLARGGQYTVAVSVLEAVSRHVRAAPRPAGQVAVVVVAVVAVEQRPGGLGVFESRRGRVCQDACRQAALPGRRLVRCRRAVSNSSPMNPRRRSQQRKVYLGLSVSGRVGLAALVVSA